MMQEEPGPSKKRAKTYYYHPEWESEFLFTSVKDKSICLICYQSVALNKKGNLERHHNSMHAKFQEEFPLNSMIRTHKVEELKGILKAKQSLSSKPVTEGKATAKGKASTEASFRISHLLAKHKKPFTDGEIIKEAMMVAADTLFKDFDNKDEIMIAIKGMPLGASTVARRVAMLCEDMSQQVHQALADCDCFSLQFSESVDMTDTAQLIVFVRMAFKDTTVKEDFLTFLPFKEQTRGEVIYKEFKRYVTEKNIPLEKLVSISTDGAPAMLDVNSGFIALCRTDPEFPSFVSYHCVIHQQALASKVVDFSHVMTVVVKMINSIRAKALQHRLFKSLLDELDATYGELILHADVRWLSRGKVLQRFLDMRPEIVTFLKSRNEFCSELSDETWLLDLGFLTDITAKINELNCKLQGKDRDLSHMMSTVNAFKLKLGLWSAQLNNNMTEHFPNLQKILQKVKERRFHPKMFCDHLNKLKEEFNSRFQELDKMEQIVMFISNPFLQVDIGELIEKFQQVFEQSSGLDMEIITMQNDLELKARSRDKDFWGLVNREKYPLLSSCALKVKAYFGSTFLYEVAFSQMKIIKSKYRTRLTDAHLMDCMRLAISNYDPDFKALSDSVQSQMSH
uniref:Uncharacterized protein n=1 Tax=Pelusios castaneus TaxID=367368 RepID=A0A8C8SXX4_9SAUR